MPHTPCVTIHMVASLDGFVARRDGRTDWLETPDHFEGGTTLTPESIAQFLDTIDCYVLGSRTYEVALDFEAKGHGWAYGGKPVVVLTSRTLPKTRDSVEFYSGDLTRLITERLPSAPRIWVVGGPEVTGACLRAGLADEVRYTVVPVLLGEGIPFFHDIGPGVALHLLESIPYTTGMVALRYAVRKTQPS
jgi:dihydrofolate reductase